MIRFLQTDNRLTKALLVVIIGAASVSMVVYLIPGLTGQGAASADTYAVVYPHWYSRFLSSGDAVSQAVGRASLPASRCSSAAAYAGNPDDRQFIEQQAGQQLVQQQILLAEAEKLGIHATNDDVRQYPAHRASLARSSSPTASTSARTAMPHFVADQFNISVAGV